MAIRRFCNEAEVFDFYFNMIACKECGLKHAHGPGFSQLIAACKSVISNYREVEHDTGEQWDRFKGVKPLEDALADLGVNVSHKCPGCGRSSWWSLSPEGRKRCWVCDKDLLFNGVNIYTNGTESVSIPAASFGCVTVLPKKSVDNQ